MARGGVLVTMQEPYCDRDVDLDIARVLGLELFEDFNGDNHLSRDQKEYIASITKETEIALQVVLRNLDNLVLGEYEDSSSNRDWKLKI